MTVARLDARFAELKREGRAGFVAYVMAGDPDQDAALAILQGLPAAGADVIELGFPFSDPMADGTAIQRAALRALAAGMTLSGTLQLARRFREGDAATPLVLECGQSGMEVLADDARVASGNGRTTTGRLRGRGARGVAEG